MFKLPGNTSGKRAFLKERKMEGFERLVKQYEPMIWRIIHSLHIYKDRTEYYQIGLIALWDAKNLFDEKKGSFTSFAYPYIRGRMLNELAKRRKIDERSAFQDDAFWNMIEDTNVQHALETENILTYCTNLTDHQKKWVLYTALANLSVKEIAEIEQVSVSAVKAWRKGARNKIIKNLSQI